MVDSSINQAKQAVRERVWAAMESEDVALAPGAYGRIPNFVGADLAAERLARLPQWKAARVVKSNPDWAQLPVRVRALEDGKLLYMAVPRLATLKPFYLLDPTVLLPPFDEVATPDGAAQLAPKVGLDEIQPVDLVVAGSVAVNQAGVRIGKGVWIGYESLIETGYPSRVTIGDRVVVGIRCTILAHFDDSKAVTIKNDVFIGPCALILPGVTIGEGAVVTAGSVVSCSVPPMTVVQGNPARPIARCGIPLGSTTPYKKFLSHLRPMKGRSESGTNG